MPLMASGDAGTRSVVLKILLGMPDRREVVRRYIVFSKTLAGWARDRALVQKVLLALHPAEVDGLEDVPFPPPRGARQAR